MFEITEDHGYPSTLLCVLSVKPFDAAGSVDQLLLAGEERVTFRTYFQVNLCFSRTGPECFTARALHHRINVVGVNVCFHLSPPKSIHDGCALSGLHSRRSSHNNYKDKADSDKLKWLQ
jgi:hypothetical protein